MRMSMVNRLRPAAVALVAALFVTLLSAPPAQAAVSADDYDKEVVRLVNVERTKRNLPALKAVPALKTKARSWSKTMKSSGSFQHASAARITADTKAAGCSSGWAENMFWSQGSKPSPKQAVKAYMASPGHRAAILNKSYRYMASGSVVSGNETHNTQRFAVKCTTSKVSGWKTKQSAKVNKAVSDVIKVNGGKRTISLQRHNGKKWVTVKKVKSSQAGRAKVTFPKSSKAQKVKYRVVVKAKGKYVQGKSKTKVLQVKK